MESPASDEDEPHRHTRGPTIGVGERARVVKRRPVVDVVAQVDDGHVLRLVAIARAPKWRLTGTS